MPRKPKPENRRITVMVNSQPIEVILYSPRGRKRTWYALWKGIPSAKSTGQVEYDEAVRAVHGMLGNGGNRVNLNEALLSDDEFIAIQKAHYSKKKGADAERRSAKSLRSCLDAITVFREITGLSPITIATPDDCENFQRIALEKPKNWRVRYAENNRSRKARKSAEDIGKIRPDTVDKWSRTLCAAFERANINAGRKCVRGIVASHKLLKSNPWIQFTRIETSGREIRHFNEEELLSLLDYFEQEWKGVSVAASFIKMCLWTSCRREEISELRWSHFRRVSSTELHFYVKGKWRVERWVRLPSKVVEQVESFRTKSDFVFDAYSQQLHRFYLKRGRNSAAKRVRMDFDPQNFGEWMYRQIKDWQMATGRDNVYLHVFRKTGLQLARQGEDVNRELAADAAVSEGVMMASYVTEADLELRNRSNRMYRRLVQRLPGEVARRYGYDASQREQLAKDLNTALQISDWATVAKLASELADVQSAEDGGGTVP